MKNMLKLLCAAMLLLTALACQGALAEDAIGISTPQELAAIANAPGEDYYLKNDIDLAGINWEPIQNFSGTLDGKGFTISNLTIDMSIDPSIDPSMPPSICVGLFSHFTGDVENLIVKNANIMANIAPDGFGYINAVSVIGIPENASQEKQIKYCEVNGSIALTTLDSDPAYVCALAGAYMSSSDVDITVTIQDSDGGYCETYATYGLKHCTASQNSGNITLVGNRRTAIYEVIGISECVDCENTGDLTATTGIAIGIGQDSTGCVNSGKVTGGYEAYGIVSSVDCINTGMIVSDKICGIYESVDCFNSGNFQDLGRKASLEILPIRDHYRNDQSERIANNNLNTGVLQYARAYGSTLDSFEYHSNLGMYSQDESKIDLSTSFDARQITIAMYSVVSEATDSGVAGGDIHIFEHDIAISSLSGNLESLRLFICGIHNGELNLNIVGDGSTSVSIEGGNYRTRNIKITATGIGHMDVLGATVYNSADIEIDAEASDIDVIGSKLVNTGSITVNNQNTEDGAISVYGAYSASFGVYNSGILSGEGSSVYVTGAVGYDAVNEGTIIAQGNYFAFARGVVTHYESQYSSVNYADIYAYANSIWGEASAMGVESVDGILGMENAGFSFGNAYAEAGAIAKAGSTHGKAYAKHTYDSYNGRAQARAPWGEAVAIGCRDVLAEAPVCQATSNIYGVTASNGQAYILASYHLDYEACDCSCDFVFPVAQNLIPGYSNFPTTDEDNIHGGSAVCTARIPLDVFMGEIPETQKPEITIPDREEKPGHESGAFTADISMTYGAKGAEQALNSFTYACGSYLFDADDCTEFNLHLAIRHTGSGEQGNFILTLPEGFSFEPYEEVRTATVVRAFAANETYTKDYVVYPLYSTNGPGSADFTLEGDASVTHSVPVVRAANEGVILCRNTVGVSRLDPSTPIRINNTVDFAKEFNTSVSTFSDRLNELGCALTQAVYVEDFMMQSFENLGFTNAVYLHGLDNHDVGCAIAQKKIVLNGKVENILMVVVRGTLDTEWIGNFVVVDEKAPNEHADFRNAANNVQERIAEYWNNCKLGESKDNIQMYICGHSRAAAATNLIVHDMNQADKPVSSDRLRAYTYAAPNSTKQGVPYTNLFNYVFLHDFVAYVPNGYEKHGQTYVVGLTEPTNTAPAKVSSLFESYSGGQKYSFPNSPYLIGAILATGERENKFLSNEALSTAIGYTLARLLPPGNGDIPQAHGAEGYLAWVNGNADSSQISFNGALKHMNGLAQDEFDRMAKIYGYSAKVFEKANKPMYILLRSMEMLNNHMGNRLLKVSCPVDVEVLDANGKVIASFNSHELQSVDQNRIVTFSVDETDYILMPRDEALSVRITGTNDGTMALNLVQVDGSKTDLNLDAGDVSARVDYTSVPLTTGESYRMVFSTAGSGTEWVLYDHEGNVYKEDTLLNAVYLPKALTELWDEAYMGTSAMKGNIVCPEGLTSIGARAFANSAIEGIYIPVGCKLIDKSAFENINPVIYCMEGSFAHTYAQTNGYEFVLMANPIG